MYFAIYLTVTGHLLSSSSTSAAVGRLAGSELVHFLTTSRSYERIGKIIQMRDRRKLIYHVAMLVKGIILSFCDILLWWLVWTLIASIPLYQWRLHNINALI